MAKGKEIKTVWLAELDRFGYMLTAVADKKEEATKAVMKNYSKTFKDLNNGTSPGKEYFYSDGDKISYYHAALEDIHYTEFELGKCYWI